MWNRQNALTDQQSKTPEIFNFQQIPTFEKLKLKSINSIIKTVDYLSANGLIISIHLRSISRERI